MRILILIIASIVLFISALVLTKITYAIFDLDTGMISWLWGMCAIPVSRIIAKFIYGLLRRMNR